MVSKSLAQQVPVMLLYVLQSTGSSPGRQGFFMAVNAAGDMEGSIGGGIMEHKFVEMAKERLLQPEEPAIKKQYHNKSAPANQSGMICSGEQTILLYQVSPSDAAAIQNIMNGNGTLQLSPQGIRFFPEAPPYDYYFSEKEWVYREKLGYRSHLHIIGGGHCSLALSQLMHCLDFYIHVYDDRPRIKTLLNNTWAHKKTTVAHYSQLADMVPSGEQQYVVVMTVGYRTDDIAIRALWDKSFRYFGILGSKSKMDKMFEVYIAEGIPAEKLQRMHAPIGLTIHSQTPEEIAVSIAAEIIRVKNHPAPPIP